MTKAAAAIVDTDGVAALTLARVAVEVGVAPPSLYKHVAGLDDLIVRVATLAIHRLNDDLTVAALGRSGRDALLALADAYRRFAIAHVGLYALTQAALDPASVAQQAEASRSLLILGAIIESYGVSKQRSVHAMRMIRAALHGFVDIEVRGGFQIPDSVDESFSIVVEALDVSLSRLGDCAAKNGAGW